MRYNYAVLSFCADLTNPRARAVPIAVVGVGDLGAAHGFAFYVSRPKPGEHVHEVKDPVSKSVLNDLPLLLQRQFSEGLAAAGTDRFLNWLQDRFRNSLHVSEISTAETSVEPALLVEEAFRLYAEKVLVVDRGSSRRPSQEPPLGFPSLEDLPNFALTNAGPQLAALPATA